MTKNKDSYSKWVDYESLDFAKRLALNSAKKTSKNTRIKNFSELTASRGESAFIWKKDNQYYASVLECLGTKNLVADETAKITGKTYYDIISHDTVAASVNDLAASGASPLVIHAFWGLWKDDWLKNKKRTQDFIGGWKKACDISGIIWGGGETPSLTKVVSKESIVLASSVTGIIINKKHVITSHNIKIGDRIVLIKSTGINANGISLIRDMASKLKDGYKTKLSSGKILGEAVLNKTNIYAKLISDIQKEVNIHYISNITGHGLRKVMRARKEYTYIIEKLFKPHEVFLFIQKHANLDDEEMYGTYNMGQDYAIFVSPKEVYKTLKIIKKNGFQGIDAGYVQKGPRQVIIKPKDITFRSESLDLG